MDQREDEIIEGPVRMGISGGTGWSENTQAF